jgi:hypothetical protein
MNGMMAFSAVLCVTYVQVRVGSLGVIHLDSTRLDTKNDRKFVLFDGPIDTSWIESMNSLMDDNKILTLSNGERISMPSQVILLFETEDLSTASPATVSRVGIVYCDYEQLGWSPIFESWLSRKASTVSFELAEDHRWVGGDACRSCRMSCAIVRQSTCNHCWNTSERIVMSLLKFMS